jgi:hypothetical protein
LHHARGIREHVVVPESNHAKSTGFQPASPLRIRLLLVRVLPSIKFNDQFGFVTNEIHHIQTQWLLPLEFEAGEPMSTHFAPQDALRIGHPVTQAFGDVG